MEERNKKHSKILAIALIFGLLFVVAFFLNPDTVSENGTDVGMNSGVDLKDDVDDNQEKIDEQLNEEKENIISYLFDANDEESTVFSGLLNYGKEDDIEIVYNNNYSFGVFVESIDGIKNGDDGKYWQYYINNVLGDVAADKKILKEGDNVEWRFEEVPF